MVNTKSLRFGLVYDIGDNHVRYSGKGGLIFLPISRVGEVTFESNLVTSYKLHPPCNWKFR